MVKLTDNQVCELIDTIQSNLMGISDINYGGCGRFAHYVANECEKLGVDYKIKIIYSTTEGSDRMHNSKQNFKKIMSGETIGFYEQQQLSFSHCCIEINGIYFDAYNVGKRNCRDLGWGTYGYFGEFTHKELKIALKVGCWNDTFLVSSSRFLRKRITYAFNKLDCTRCAE